MIVRLQFILSTIFMHYGPNRDNFVALRANSDEHQLSSTIWCAVVAIVNCAIAATLVYLMVDRKVNAALVKNADSAGGEAGTGVVNLKKILLYIYGREHYIFLFILHASASMFCWTCFESHHGFDFTLNFQWIGCGYNGGGEGQEDFVMQWPLCVAESPTNQTNGTRTW